MSETEEQCSTQEVMLGVSWLFAIVWALMFLVWTGVLITGCAKQQLRWVQTIMLIVPFFHLGDAAWQLFTYTHCVCLRCSFESEEDIYAWVGSQYTFSLGRLTALLLCLFIIATGAGTVRSSMLPRNWVLMVFLFAGFLTATALGLPLSRQNLGIDNPSFFILSIIMYAGILTTIFVESYGNSRVLKAQLVMIRAQGIAPQTTPAFSKFALFTRLRRWVFGYFILHTFIIIAQIVPQALWQRVVLLVLWEITQILVTVVIAYAFRAGVIHASGHNPYLEREQLLSAGEVRQVVSAEEVSLGWDDLGAMRDVTEDADNSTATTPLVPWRSDMSVPPPPRPMPIISVFRVSRPAMPVPRSRTHPQSAVPVATGVPVASSAVAAPAVEMSALGTPPAAQPVAASG